MSRLLLLVLALAACRTSERTPRPPPTPKLPADKKALAWRCTNVDLVFLPGTAGKARLRINEEVRDVTLHATPTGLKYGDDQVSFWTTGDEGFLDMPDLSETCRFDAARTELEDARERGVAFRATGKSWILEIGPDHLVLTTDGAGYEGAAPTPTEDVATGAITWASTGEHTVQVTATPQSCAAGPDWSARFTVEAVIDGEPYTGCGDRLR